MAIDTVWTNPTSLARAAGQSFPYAYYEDLASDVNRLGGTDGNTKTGPYVFDQTTDDTDILLFRSTGDVAHGVTTVVATTDYGAFRKIGGATGGLQVMGLAESAVEVGLYAIGIAGTDATGKAAASAAYVVIEGQKINGTGTQNPGANANILAVRSNGNNKLIVDQEGDLHVDGSTSLTAFDHHMDHEIARAIRAMMAPKDSDLRKNHQALVTKHQKTITDAGLMTMDRNGEPAMANVTRIGYFQLDAVHQLGTRLDALEARVNALAPGNGGRP